MVLSDLAAAALEGVGAAAGLLMPAPLVAKPEDPAIQWRQANPMARVVPAPYASDADTSFAGKSVAELKHFLSSRKVSQSELEQCVEKSDLVALCQKQGVVDKDSRLTRFRGMGNLLGLCVL